MVVRNETSTSSLEISTSTRKSALSFAPSKMVELGKPEPMNKQNAPTDDLTKHFVGLPEGWLQNELFEQTRNYLTRGRRFERLRIDQLNEEWAMAFRQFVRLRVGPHVRDMDDAGAELRLRGDKFPTYLVRSEVERLRTSIWPICSISPSAEFDRKIDEFVVDLNKPKN
jgi:hypothetical protein